MHIQNGQAFKVSKRPKEKPFKDLITLKTNVTFYKLYYVKGPFKSLEKPKLLCNGHREKKCIICMKLAEIVQMDPTANLKLNMCI